MLGDTLLIDRGDLEMLGHTTALVPIESWAYQSPEIRAVGKQVDVGLFAESLVYYDVVLLNVANQPQFAEFLRWLLAQQMLDDFLALVREGVIRIYEYSFVSAPVLKDGRYILLNIQDQLQAQPNSFEQRFLYHPDIEAVLPKARHRQKLYRTFRDRVIEVKAGEFGAAIENAKADHLDPKRSALVVQYFVDELYGFRGLTDRPTVVARIEHGTDIHTIHFNVSFDVLGRLAGTDLNVNSGTPLAGSIHANRLIWSAASLNCDLFLPSPIAMLVGDKLYEAEMTTLRARGIIEQLQASVEFPDLRRLVNAGQLTFSEVLRIRNKANRFRKWLQNESDRDRDALIAYHHEVAKEAGLLRFGRRALSLFGVIGGGALGSALGALTMEPTAAAATGAAGSAAGYLLDVVSRIHAEWRPVVFGNWMKERIAKLRSKDQA